jgi:peroxiredoxin (alkyl hydroperoxide reductase subunit C)
MAKILQKAPHFSADARVSKEVKMISLDEYAGKYLVLFFYPGDLTFICPTEAVELDKHLGEFQKHNAEVVICSNDDIKTHQEWVATPRNKRGLGQETKIPLLADVDKAISKAYNVYLEEQKFPARGVFIIDPKGVIRHIMICEPGVGRNIEEILRLLKASQKHAETNQGCPVNWTSDKETIGLTEESSKTYFKDL